MNLKQMAVFREVILTGSVSEAARNLNRTQPSVSHALATLEESLGMRLFERRRGRLHPVPEAQYLFREADEVLRRVGSISQNMKRMKAVETGELRVVSMPGPASVLLPEIISEIAAPNPEIKATLLSRSSDAVVQLVGSQQFDVGIADHDPARDIETTLVEARTFRFNSVCAVPARSALAKRRTLTPQDLADQPLAALFPEHRSHLIAKRAFEAADISFNVRFIGQFFLPLLAYVERGLASAIVDPLTAESWLRATPNRSAVVFLPFSPSIPFEADLLTPAYRPGSILAGALVDKVEALFLDAGGQEIKQTGPDDSSTSSAG